MWAGERDTRCQGPAGPTSMPLHVRPRIKVALGAEPSSAGLAGGSMAAGPWGLAWAAGAAGVHLHPHIAGRVAWDPFEQGSSSLAALLRRPGGGPPCSLSLAVPGPSAVSSRCLSSPHLLQRPACLPVPMVSAAFLLSFSPGLPPCRHSVPLVLSPPPASVSSVPHQPP